MIRINLLGGPRKKRSRSRSMPGIASLLANPLLLVAGALVLGAIGNGMYYMHLVAEHDRIDRAIKTAELENHRLSLVKASYLQAEKEKEDYKRRVDVIEQLRANQSGPVQLLAAIGDTVNGTDAVWLSSVSDEGNVVNMQGMALTPSAVANLMRNLQKTGYFKSVEIKETFQDDQLKEIQAFQFTLTCEKAPQQKS